MSASIQFCLSPESHKGFFSTRPNHIIRYRTTPPPDKPKEDYVQFLVRQDQQMHTIFVDRSQLSPIPKNQWEGGGINYSSDERPENIHYESPFFPHIKTLKPSDIRTGEILRHVQEQTTSSSQPFDIPLTNLKTLLEKTRPLMRPILSAPYFAFFEKTSLAAGYILDALQRGIAHRSKYPQWEDIVFPGLYLSYTPNKTNIFINCKKSAPVGAGAYGKIKRVIWLNPPGGNPRIIAKKVWQDDVTEEEKKHEIEQLQTFQNQPGILSMINSGLFHDKYALFTELYDTDLYSQTTSHPLLLTSCNRLMITQQLLQGLTTIAEKGVHADLKQGNIFLKKRVNGDVEAVIGDFRSFTSYNRYQWGRTSWKAAPPEYFLSNSELSENILQKHDVWGMGLVLYHLYKNPSSAQLPSVLSKPNSSRYISDLKSWAASLKSDWILTQGSFLQGTPRLIRQLINEMLEPDPQKRISAQEALDQLQPWISYQKIARLHSKDALS